MSTLTLEDLIVEAATELAISGLCDVPVENLFGGVDLVAPGYYEGRAFSNFLGSTFTDGVRIAVEDNVIHIYKFERMGVVAHATFAAGFANLSSAMAAVAKAWL
jgi:hypothetical protein